MRRREISPEFWTDERVVELSDAAKLLFIGLWNLADREGRIEDRPKTIGFKVRPWAPAEVTALLAELTDAGLVSRYEADGVAVICVPGFTEHQRPHPKEIASKLPPPPPSREKQRQAVESNGEQGKAGTDRAGSSFPSGSSGSSGSAGAAQAAAAAEPKALGLVAFHIEAPDPALIDQWTVQDFWRAFELDRRAAGYPPEKWPPPNSLRDWWQEARGAFDVAVLGMAAQAFCRDEHWQRARPACPWAGFAKQWARFIPRKAAAS